VRKRPDIPEDVFFDSDQSEETDDAEPEEHTDKRQGSKRRPRSYVRLSEQRKRGSRIGRPPAQEGPKVAVTLYLTEPVAHLLEEARFLLLSEHGVKTSKSAIADFALRYALEELEAAAEDLRRD